MNYHKKLLIFFLFFAISIIFIYCKKNETPYEPPEDAYYFKGKVKGISKSFTENVNSYKLYKNGECGTDGSNSYVTYSTGFKQESGYYILSNERIRISFKNIYKQSNWNGDSLFNNYFKPNETISWYSLVNVDTSTTDTLTINGVEVTWIDGEGKLYSSQWGDQSSSLFVIKEATLLSPGVLIRVKAEFNCRVYDMLGNYLVMNDCTIMCPFEEPCF